MADSAALKDLLTAVEAELDGLGDRRKALQQAAKDLKAAIASVEALGDLSTSTPTRRRRRSSSSSRPASKRPTVTPEDLTGALGDLGGEATVEQLVEKLELPDGRSLNGARRIAVDAGSVTYEDRTYKLAG